MRTIALIQTLLLTLLLCSKTNAQNICHETSAENIILQNPGFEEVSVNDGSWNSNAPGWIESTNLGKGTYNPTNADFLDPVPEGSNVAYINIGPNSLLQTTGETIEEGATYSLTIDVGNRLNVDFSDYIIALESNGEVLASLSNEPVPDGRFISVSISYTAQPTHIGQPLSIRLDSLSPSITGSGPQVNFDNVRLSKIQGIILQNPGFEEVSVNDGSWNSNVPGWVEFPNLGKGTYNPRNTDFIDPVPEGSNVAYINLGPNSLIQATSEIIEEGSTYCLIVDVGNRLNVDFSDYSIALESNGEVLASISNEPVPDGRFNSVSISYTAQPTHIGQPLSIRLNSLSPTATGSGPQVNFDNLRLSKTRVTGKDFVTTWDTTTNLSIDLGVDPNYSSDYNFNIQILDNNNNIVGDYTGINGAFLYTVPNPGIYTIRINGEKYPNPYFFGSNAALNGQLISVDQWGDIEWKSMNRAFFGITTDLSTSDVPDLTRVTDASYMFANSNVGNLAVLSNWDMSSINNMSYMFWNAIGNPVVDGWDVSNVTNMAGMFWGADDASPELRTWDVSSVNNMNSMFSQTRIANPNLGDWDVTKVTDMGNMFSEARGAEPDLSGWDVSNVTDMSYMFDGAVAANLDLSSWNVSSVIDMKNMFSNATFANSDLSRWDVSSVTDMSRMFLNATLFNPEVGSWEIENVNDMENMLAYSGLSTNNYDSLLVNFAGQDVVHNINFSASNTPYCTAGFAREILINDKGWTIADGGLDCFITDVSIDLPSGQVLDGNNPQLIIWVKNSGNQYVNNVAVEVTLDNSNTSNIFWTCDHAGLSCNGTSGTVYDTISAMPPDSVVTYAVNFDIVSNDGDELDISGSVSTQPSIDDGFQANNTFNKNIPIIMALFKSDFE